MSVPQLLQIFPGNPAAPIPEGVRAGEMIYASALTGADPATGQAPGELVAQMEQALRNMQALVERGGGSLDNVGRVTGIVNRADERDAIYDPWDALFPDAADRPAFKVLQAPLPPGILVQLSMLALVGGHRQRIDIPGVPARDPTVKIGNWVFSSRLHGTDPATSTTPDDDDAQAEHAYGNALRLVELAGGTLANITQITAFVRDQDGAQLAERHFQRVFGDAANRPAFWAVNAFIRPQMKLMVEFVATL